MFKVEKKRWQNFLCLAFRSKAGKFQPMRDYFHPPYPPYNVCSSYLSQEGGGLLHSPLAIAVGNI